MKRGIRFANNIVRPRHKKLSTLMIYATERCDSKCLHCNVWKKHPSQNLSFEKFVEILNSKCVTKDTVIGLEGGEFLLHPEANKIMEWLSKNHPKFDILSNCLNPDKLINAVKTYSPQRLYVSLDGMTETYKFMRGKDGFDKVIKVIEECKTIVPISLMFTLTPFNSFKDMEDIIAISQKYEIDIRVGLYSDIDFFDTENGLSEADFDKLKQSADIYTDFKKTIPKAIKETSENYDFLLLYEEWRSNNLNLKCHSILDSLVIHPNGDVPICQFLPLKLGNVNNNTLDEIFNSAATKKIHKEHTNGCNKCWINFHRKYDVVLLRSAEKLLPKKLIEVFYGKYQWTHDKKMTYKKFMKKYEE
jgi:MoaA/NifB/PqqE/SkfB family radical SAM enzyme